MPTHFFVLQQCGGSDQRIDTLHFADVARENQTGPFVWLLFRKFLFKNPIGKLRQIIVVANDDPVGFLQVLLKPLGGIGQPIRPVINAAADPLHKTIQKRRFGNVHRRKAGRPNVHDIDQQLFFRPKGAQEGPRQTHQHRRGGESVDHVKIFLHPQSLVTG